MSRLHRLVRRGSRATDELDGDSKREGKEAKQAQLEEKVRQDTTACWESFELGSHDEDPSHNRDQADEQERLNGDPVRTENETERVSELGNDQKQQDTIENRDPSVHGAGARRDRMHQLVHRADENKNGGCRKKNRYCAVENGLEADQST